MTLGTPRYVGPMFALILLLTMPGCVGTQSGDKEREIPKAEGVTPSQAETSLGQDHTATKRFCVPGGLDRLQNAADQGQISAQAELGMLYLDGRCDLPTDSQQAAYWLAVAAERGDMRAQENLAFMYQAGQPIRWPYRNINETGWYFAPGIPQDYPKALAWYRRCADQGNVRCQRELGAMYGLGYGTPKDEKQYYYWLLIANRSGSEFDKKCLLLVEKKFSNQDIDEVRNLAKKWQPVLELPTDPMHSP